MKIEVDKFKNMTQDIEIQLRSFLLHPSNESEFQREISVKPEWNITTLFGLLLDYPVVYWYEDIEDGKTCLACKDLIRYTINYNSLLESHSNKSSVVSFTIPKCVFSSSIESSIERWITECRELATINKANISCEKKQVNLSTIVL